MKIVTVAVLMALLGGAMSCSYKHQVKGLPGLAGEPYERVAVLPLENYSGTRGANRVVTDLLVDHLQTAQEWEVVDLESLSIPEEDLTTKVHATARHLHRSHEVDLVLYGTLVEYRYRVNSKRGLKEPIVGFDVRALDAARGEVIWASTFARSSPSPLKFQRDPLARVAALTVADCAQALVGSNKRKAARMGVARTEGGP